MTGTAKQLDIRTVPPPQRHPKIFGTFDALAADEAFVLINDHEPKPLLYHLQVERAGQFDWSVLESGPTRYRIEIRRRAPTARHVSECLGKDHDRLDAILAEVRSLTGGAGFTEATERFAEFMCGLDRHIRAEEEILFPVFEARSPMGQGPTTVMRGEHRTVRQGMDDVLTALRGKNSHDSLHQLTTLAANLLEHNQKEEQILYPMIDQLAPDDRGRDDLVRQVQAL